MDLLFYGTIAVGAAIVGGIYYFVNKRGVKTKGQTENETAPAVEIEGQAPYFEAGATIPVIMFDRIIGKWYASKISAGIAGKIIEAYQGLGSLIEWGTGKVYLLERWKSEAGELLVPVTIPDAIPYYSTERYQDINQPEVKRGIAGISKEGNKSMGDEIIKYLPWLLAFFFLGIILIFGE